MKIAPTWNCSSEVPPSFIILADKQAGKEKYVFFYFGVNCLLKNYWKEKINCSSTVRLQRPGVLCLKEKHGWTAPWVLEQDTHTHTHLQSFSSVVSVSLRQSVFVNFKMKKLEASFILYFTVLYIVEKQICKQSEDHFCLMYDMKRNSVC